MFLSGLIFTFFSTVPDMLLVRIQPDPHLLALTLQGQSRSPEMYAWTSKKIVKHQGHKLEHREAPSERQEALVHSVGCSEVVEFPTLEIFQSLLGSLLQAGVPAWAGRWVWWPPEVPSARLLCDPGEVGEMCLQPSVSISSSLLLSEENLCLQRVNWSIKVHFLFP